MKKEQKYIQKNGKCNNFGKMIKNVYIGAFGIKAMAEFDVHLNLVQRKRKIKCFQSATKLMALDISAKFKPNLL